MNTSDKNKVTNTNNQNIFTLLDNISKVISLLESENKALSEKVNEHEKKNQKTVKKEKLNEKHLKQNNSSDIQNKSKSDRSNYRSIADSMDMTEAQVSEFTYIFIKNIEAKELNQIFINDNFLKEFYLCLKDKELPTKLANKIIRTLKV